MSHIKAETDEQKVRRNTKKYEIGNLNISLIELREDVSSEMERLGELKQTSKIKKQLDKLNDFHEEISKKIIIVKKERKLVEFPDVDGIFKKGDERVDKYERQKSYFDKYKSVDEYLTKVENKPEKKKGDKITGDDFTLTRVYDDSPMMKLEINKTDKPKVTKVKEKEKVKEKVEAVELITEFKEIFNADRLAYIIKNKVQYDQYIRYDGTDPNWKPFLLPEKYLKKSIGGNVNILYKYAESKTDGRLYANGSLSLQGFCREIRHTIANEYYTDIDIVNCHPVILSHLCVKYKINCDLLKQYISNRDNIINDIMNSNNNITRDDVKTAILSLMNGGSGSYNKIAVKTDFLKKFKAEIKNTLNTICEIEKDEYKVFVPKNDYNKQGGFVNRLLCIEENIILQRMVHFFKCKKGDIAVLCFDGIMLPKDKKYDLEGCEKYIKQTVNYDIKLKEKPMDEGFDLPDEIPAFDPSTFEWSVDNTEIRNLLTGTFNDVDVSQYMLKLYGDEFKVYFNCIYHWNGKYWEKDISGKDIPLHKKINNDFFTHLKEKAYKLFGSDNDKLEEFQNALKKLNKIRSNTAKKGIIDEFKMVVDIGKDDIFDLNPDLLCFKNGVYDLSKGEFREARKEDYITLTIPYDYREPTQEEINKFDDFFNKVMPVEDERKFLLKCLSSCLGGRTLENVLIMTGSGRNGKDTLLSYLLKGTLGRDLFYYNSNTVITGANTAGANQEKNNMNKKRCVLYNEPEKDKTLKVSTLKEITGGEEINARGIYKSDTTVNLNATNIIMCNDIPPLDDPDEAMGNRLIVIEFRAMFRTPEKIAEYPKDTPYLHLVDTYYKEKKFIQENRIPFLHLLLKSYVDFRNDGHKLTGIPESIKKLSSAYMANSDHFLNWFNDAFDKTGNQKDYIKMIDLYEKFRSSDYYENLSKKDKRSMNKKKLIDIVKKNPHLKGFYRDRKEFGKVTVGNCILCYKLKPETQFIDDDDD